MKMDLPPSRSCPFSNAPSSLLILPDELIMVVLSFLSVTSLMRMRCVSKFFNFIIFDPVFIQMHLHRSARNPRLALVLRKRFADFCFATTSITQLLENPLVTFNDNLGYSFAMKNCWLVGSCNGLLCFLDHFTLPIDGYRNAMLVFYNPATRIASKKVITNSEDKSRDSFVRYRYMFGYDNSSNTYKVVVLNFIGEDKTKLRTEVRILSLGDNVWRNIEGLFFGPLRLTFPSENHGVFLNGNVYWLALRNCFRANRFYDSNGITIDQFVIISLDLGTETHIQLLPPRGFDEVPHVEPTICMLTNSLCFCHDFKKTHFVIWKMENFGIIEVWTQVVKISYDYLPFRGSWLPLHISDDSNTLILAKGHNKAIIYNQKDNIAKKLPSKLWYCFCKDYVESLVSIC